MQLEQGGGHGCGSVDEGAGEGAVGVFDVAEVVIAGDGAGVGVAVEEDVHAGGKGHIEAASFSLQDVEGRLLATDIDDGIERTVKGDVACAGFDVGTIEERGVLDSHASK